MKRTLSHALARAAHWFALTCLAGALAALIILRLSTTAAGNAAVGPSADGATATANASDSATIAATANTANAATANGVANNATVAALADADTATIAAALALLLMAAVLVALSLRRTVVLSVAYLVVGSVATYLYTMAVLGMPDVFPSSNIFLVTLPKLALVMVGGAGTAALVGVLWGTAGFVLAEAVTVFAAARTGVPYGEDVYTISTYFFLVTMLLLTAFVRRQRAVQAALHRAMQTDQTRLLRHDLELRALALNQDTTLNQLVAVARAHPGPLSDQLAGSIRDSLQTLRGTDWLTDVDAQSVEPSQGTDAWLTSEVYAAIERSRDRGLVVEVSGQRAALCRLSPASDRELGLAVQQCLVNVILHSGKAAAEVVIESEPTSISLMVMDAGRGFTESETDADRLGLRQAVRRRIEQLGGSVSVFTRPGAGTSVLLSVPVPAEEIGPEPRGIPGAAPAEAQAEAQAAAKAAPQPATPARTDTPDPERVPR